MRKHIRLLVLGTIIFLLSCGPDKIILCSGLDTSRQHNANGQHFLECGKFSDAQREFERARELDPGNIEAYVGLGLAAAHHGDFAAGFNHLQKAQTMVDSEEQRAVLQKGYDRLYELMRQGQSE